MTDSAEMCDAPLTVCEVEVTPGWMELSVIDLDTGKEVPRVTKVDCEAGLVWILPEGGLRRSQGQMGRFKLVCSREALERYQQTWKSWGDS